MSIKEQMLEAREYIRVKDYDKAREILVTIDHPKAREWLDRIDQMSTSISDGHVMTTPNSSTRRGMYVFGALLAVVLMVGGGLMAFLLNQSNAVIISDDSHLLARYFPDTTVVYADLRIDDEHIQTWDTLMLHIQAKLPSFVTDILGDEPYTYSKLLDSLTESLLNGDFQTTIRSWLGDWAACGFFDMPDFSGMQVTDDLELSWACIIEITNHNGAVAFIERLLSTDTNHTYVRSDDNDYTEFRSSNRQAVMLIRDNLFIYGSDQGVTTLQGDILNTLADSAKFNETVAMLPKSQYNAFVYVHIEYLYRSLLPMFEDLQATFTQFASSMPNTQFSPFASPSFTFDDLLPEGLTMNDMIDALGQMATGITIVDDYTLLVDGVHNVGNSEIFQKMDYLMPNYEPTNPDFLNYIPENASIVTHGTDIKTYVDTMLASEQMQIELMDKFIDTMPLPDGYQLDQIQASITRIDDIIESATGMTVLNDVLGWMTGDYAVFVSYTPSVNSMLFSYYYPDSEIKQNIEAGMIIEVTDAQKARDVIDKLGHSIPLILNDLELTVTDETIAGQSAIVIHSPRRDYIGVPLDIVIGSNDKVLVIATRQSATDILNGKGGFKSSDGYVKVQPRLLPTLDSMTYINTDGVGFIADALIGLMPPFMSEMLANMSYAYGDLSEEEIQRDRQQMRDQVRSAFPLALQGTRIFTSLFDSITTGTVNDHKLDTVSRFTLTFAD